MPIESISDIPPLIATSVVRGSQQGQSHGGVYLIVPETKSVHQMIDWNTAGIDWAGRGWDRGLRGIAFHNDAVYIAASDELFIYDQQFQKLRSFRNRYLKHCHEIVVHNELLYLTSTGFDSILAFDLNADEFRWGMHVSKVDGNWLGHRFEPDSDVGPPFNNLFHINNVSCDEDSLHLSGLHTGGIVSLGADGNLFQSVELPTGAHNAQPFRDGVVFNDTAAGYLRYVTTTGSEKRFPFPQYEESDIDFGGISDSMTARQGFGRGLCVLSDRLVGAGSSPSTVSVFDLESEQQILSVNFSMDIRNAIHGLEIWPYPLPNGVA